MPENNLTFRPKARIIHTIGKDLIANPNIAILELVKNSYDADATKVEITKNTAKGFRHITINDNGHGMTRDDIENKWLILATENKKYQPTSPRGRIRLGNKGIGRYASALLGNKLHIKSCTDKEIVDLSLDWEEFSNDKYLDEIIIAIDSKPNSSSKPSGTSISITNTISTELFDTIDRVKLQRELSLLIDTKDQFLITYMDEATPIPIQAFSKQYPDIIERLYHYRMRGTITADNQVSATLTIKDNDVVISEKTFDKEDFVAIQKYSKNGFVSFDIKVFNRDRWGKADLAHIAETNNIGTIIDNLYGVSIYRNGACLQPYGQTDYDWLLLDKERVQNPSVRIGNNQVWGVITIENEENTGLIENSSREGLRQNKAYEDFVKKFQYIIHIIGQERAQHRKGTPSTKQTEVQKINNEIDAIISLRNIITPEIKSLLDDHSIDATKQDIIVSTIQEPAIEKIQEFRNIYIKEIHNLEIYALLGKLVARVSHELATPITNIRTAREIIMNETSFLVDEIRKRIDRKLTVAIKYLANLKDMIKPLSESKIEMEDINLSQTIEDILDTYKNSAEYGHIIFIPDIKTEAVIRCFKADIHAILHNLIDNSNFWCSRINVSPQIAINISEDKDNIKIDVIDNGPGVAPKISDIMFEAGTTLKPAGSGLGLSIISSLLSRINGQIKHVQTEAGAHFCIIIPKNKG